MRKIRNNISMLSVFIAIILSSCSAILSEQAYVRVDDDMSLKRVWSGLLFTIPEKRNIHKVIIIGKGVVKNIEIQARVDKDKWKTIKAIKKTISFPYEIRTMVRADAIRILQKTMAGRGRIETIELYGLEEK